MSVRIREGRPEDAEPCGRICYDAFRAISTAHGFPPDFPSEELAVGVLSMLLAHPGYHVVVAERDGSIVGSNAVDERGPIAGIGPITVDPDVQDGGIGWQLMRTVVDRQIARSVAGIRLVQAAFHNRSLSLYTKLGFDAREPLSCIQGPPIRAEVPGHLVRPARTEDLAECDRVCLRVHGHTRTGEVRDAIAAGGAAVVEWHGRIVGYATGIAFFSHAVAESTTALQALIAAAPSYGGPGFLVPTRDAQLLRWCLGHGLRIVQPLTLMTMGLYNEPAGSYLPSIAY
jgi:GNAT superfamily N-acetyltransferase